MTLSSPGFPEPLRLEGSQALVDRRDLPGHPDCDAYEVTGPTFADVERAVASLTDAPGASFSEFYTPRKEWRPDMRWVSRGYVRRMCGVRDSIVLDALHNARIELGAFIGAGAGPSTRRTLDDVCKAIEAIRRDRDAYATAAE